MKDENKNQLQDWDQEAYVENPSDQSKGLSNFFTRKRVLRMFVRWGLTVVLYKAFWHIAWVRWSLVVVAPMIAFNLGILIWYYLYLSKEE